MKRAFPALAAIFAFFCAACSDGQTNAGADGADAPAFSVVDVSAGPEAANYPVTMLDELPADFGAAVYKTAKILLRWIAPGSFSMGKILEATPIREVTISKGFYMGV